LAEGRLQYQFGKVGGLRLLRGSDALKRGRQCEGQWVKGARAVLRASSCMWLWLCAAHCCLGTPFGPALGLGMGLLSCSPPLRPHRTLVTAAPTAQVAPLGPMFVPSCVASPPQRPMVTDLRLQPSQRSTSCYR